MDRWYWVRSSFIAAASALVIAVPTRLIPNGFFTRMTPNRPQDYAFLLVSSDEGCPICNKVVVALLGASGAML